MSRSQEALRKTSWLPNWKLTRFASSHLIGLKNSVNFDGRLSFRGGKERFRLKKLSELDWTLLRVFHQSMKYFNAVTNFAKQVNKIRLLKVLFVNKLLSVN